jgi:mevalonate kinase
LKSKFFSGEGHGKLILTGEHSVVYGHPAIAVGITTKTTVQLHPLRGPSQLDPSASDHRLEQVVSTLLPNGYRIRIHSALPTGRGMGSSAALSVALVRARAQAQGHDLSPDELFEQAMKAERIFHTMPSGLDALVSGQGGVVYFEKGEPPRTESLPQPKWSIIVLDSGHSGNTSAMVKQVAAQRPAVNQTYSRNSESQRPS